MTQLQDRATSRQGRPVDHYRVVFVGGGNAGISVAARLRHHVSPSEIAVLDPAEHHYYQPLWTLVGGGVFPREKSERSEASVIPGGVDWVQEAVSAIDPEHREVVTAGGRRIGYDVLVVAPGIQVDWDRVKGLPEALGRGGVCSNYSYDTVAYTWETIQSFKGGDALFTHPNTPIKCGGAPQKIAYLADDAFRKAGIRGRSDLFFLTAGAGLFAVPKYAVTLENVVRRKEIDVRLRHNLVEIRPDRKEAVFDLLDSGDQVALHYDMIHVTPPMSAPRFIAESGLGDDKGWLDVDKYTLRHTRYPEVFGLGDASNLPTSKTGSAIRKQAPVAADNIQAVLEGRTPDARYDGYTACPIVTGYGKLVLAEFDYDLKPRETFPFDQAKERKSMYLLKKYALPALYWNGFLKGRL